MHMLTHTAPQHEAAAPLVRSRSAFHPLENAGDCGEACEESNRALPPLATSASSSKSHGLHASNDALLPNPWRQRTTLDDLEDRQRRDPHGVAQFRPVLQASRDSFRSPSNGLKPLLEPYLCAQNLAQEVRVDTWHLRRARYLQWLRKGAATAPERQVVHGGPSCQAAYLGMKMSTVTRLGSGDNSASTTRRTFKASGKSHLESLRTGTSSTTHPSMPLLSPSLHTTLPEVKEYNVSPTHTSVSVKERISAASNTSLLLSRTNPNELAVRCLFQAARMGAAAVVDSSAVETTSLSKPDEVASSLSVQCTSESLQRWPHASLVHETTGGLDNGGGATLPCEHRGAGAVAVDINTFAKAVGASGAASGPPRDLFGDLFTDDVTFGLFDLGNEARGEEECASTSNSTMALPPEYDLVDILRNRMHRVVATFTPSSKHTLDEPPVVAKTHTILGKARLATNTPTQALLVKLVESERASRTAVNDEAFPAQQLSAASESVARALRRLLYEEEYERDLLRQLALQSSPTRWYSTLLPSGEEGVRFRIAIPPTMTDDIVIRERLRSAMLHAAQAIAQPRCDAVAAEKACRHATLPVFKNTCGGQSWFPEEHARLMVERAASAKALLFQQWTSLHAKLSAQLCLFTEEAEQRHRLLGEFLSCMHPAPCVCLTCDLEVLAMSAVQLEPTVKPVCWYVSVVLGRHKDVLQQELLVQYQAEFNRLYDFFRVEFSALYSYKKLVADEGRRFRQTIQYHEFCLRVAASHQNGQQQPRSEATSPEDALMLRPSSRSSIACTPERTALAEVVLDSAASTPMRASSLYRGDSRMWRLRQRRLRNCAALDSPFFSYLLYTEVLITAATEDEVRTVIVVSETTARAELKTHMLAEESCLRLLEREWQNRARIVAEQDEAYNTMHAGPLVELHAAHVAEVQAVQTATYAKCCKEALQSFVEAAVAEKLAAGMAELNWYCPFVCKTRHLALTLLVVDSSATQSKASSRKWLDRQQHMSLFNSEQRLRDRTVLVEEADARECITAAAEVSLRHARQLEARRLSEEMAAVRKAALLAAEAVQRARDKEEATIRAQLQREERAADPSKRPSTNMRPDTVNSFLVMTTALEEDFEVFLPSLSSDS
ncbi:hypothetical protein Q4I30_005338 [Leishmania utingensis]|uniref:Uncharacterized protein n=1 Tax=Leishmania utingensis TaxID=653362 RepID=A0AAW3AA20_9TRYP